MYVDPSLSFDKHDVDAGALSCSVKKPKCSYRLVIWGCMHIVNRETLTANIIKGCYKWKLWSPNLNEMHYLQWTE